MWQSQEESRPPLEKYIDAGESRLLALGDFARFRDTIGYRGEEHELHILINRLRSAYEEWPSEDHSQHPSEKDTHPTAKAFFTAIRDSVPFHTALFQTTSAAGFGPEHRPAIEKYFADVREANEGVFEFKPQLDALIQNAHQALDAVFPTHVRQAAE